MGNQEFKNTLHDRYVKELSKEQRQRLLRILFAVGEEDIPSATIRYHEADTATRKAAVAVITAVKNC